jgi:hypothetical protein
MLAKFRITIILAYKLINLDWPAKPRLDWSPL